MITYVKGQYVEAYNLLYQEAVEELNKYYAALPEADPNHGKKVEQADIQNLAQYFYYMRDLTQIDVAKNELKFTKLPLDEAHFTIDLNKREITVPDDFKKNGVSVRGDEVAEIVYFEVDRYYDATDLNEQEIIIEWINADNKKGFSRPYGVDVDLIPGKIVFGWPLSSKITSKDGTIQFAVRFYSAKDTASSSGVVYSLSTLMQTVKVNSTIDIDLKDILDKSTSILEDNTIDIIAGRATNSQNNQSAQPGTPVIFYIGEELGAADGNGTAVPADMARVVYIHTDKDNEIGAVTVSAGIYIDGDGIATGSFWRKYTYEMEEMHRELTSRATYETMSDAEKANYDVNFFDDHIYIDYAEVSVTEAKAEIAARPENSAGIIYYIKETVEGKDRYRKIASATVAAMNENEGPVYRQDFTATVSDVGVYQFVARVTTGSNEKDGNSHYILVFPPVRPKNVQVVGPALMEKNENEVYSTTLTATMDDFGTELDEDLLPPAFVEYEKNKELYPFDGSKEWATYKWYVHNNVKAPVEDLATAEWEVLAGTAETLEINGAEGYYKCGITGHLNNAVSEEIFSEPRRVTMPASEFTLAISGQDVYGDAIETVTNVDATDENAIVVLQGIQYAGVDNQVKGLKVVPTLAQAQYTDGFVYEWYRYVCNQENTGEYNIDRKDALAAVQGKYEPDMKGSIAWPADLLQEGANAAEFVPTQDGVYFCVVTNTYNADTEVVCSPFMAFNYNDNN